MTTDPLITSAPLINWSDDLKDTVVLTHAESADIIATQMLSQTTVKVKNLSEQIADVVLEWTVQGAAILELHLIDPWLKLLTSGFIGVDDAGMLKPLEVHYPPDSDCYWWLAACAPTSDLGAPNLVLTFEDRLVAQMRDQGGAKTSTLGETRAAFIASLVRTVPGVRFWAPSAQDLVAAGTFVGVGNAILTGTTNPVVTPPASSKAPGASPQRKNPAKVTGPTPETTVSGVAVGAAGAANSAAGAVVGVLDLLQPPPGITLPQTGQVGNTGHGTVG